MLEVDHPIFTESNSRPVRNERWEHYICILYGESHAYIFRFSIYDPMRWRQPLTSSLAILEYGKNRCRWWGYVLCTAFLKVILITKKISMLVMWLEYGCSILIQSMGTNCAWQVVNEEVKTTYKCTRCQHKHPIMKSSHAPFTKYPARLRKNLINW